MDCVGSSADLVLPSHWRATGRKSKLVCASKLRASVALQLDLKFRDVSPTEGREWKVPIRQVGKEKEEVEGIPVVYKS
jgi:hypothetical protein